MYAGPFLLRKLLCTIDMLAVSVFRSALCQLSECELQWFDPDRWSLPWDLLCSERLSIKPLLYCNPQLAGEPKVP